MITALLLSEYMSHFFRTLFGVIKFCRNVIDAAKRFRSTVERRVYHYASHCFAQLLYVCSVQVSSYTLLLAKLPTDNFVDSL